MKIRIYEQNYEMIGVYSNHYSVIYNFNIQISDNFNYSMFDSKVTITGTRTQYISRFSLLIRRFEGRVYGDRLLVNHTIIFPKGDFPKICINMSIDSS